jgi:hypothetical protein
MPTPTARVASVKLAVVAVREVLAPANHATVTFATVVPVVRRNAVPRKPNAKKRFARQQAPAVPMRPIARKPDCKLDQHPADLAD